MGRLAGDRVLQFCRFPEPVMSKESRFVIAGVRNLLLGALPPDVLALLSPTLREVMLKRGCVLHEPGALIEHVYFPHDALIFRIAVMQRGEAVAAAAIGWEGAVGTAVALERTHAISRAMVQLPGMAARMPASDFRAAALRSPVLRKLVARFDAFQMEQLVQVAGCNAVHDLSARLSRLLLECADRVGDDFELTQEVLAQMLGVRRTTVTLVAQSLQVAGLIRYRRGRIELVDRAALQASACECYQTLRQRARELLPAGVDCEQAESSAVAVHHSHSPSSLLSVG
jgi:CRP-like cAMP-binding protein